MKHKTRLQRIQLDLEKHKFDALLVTHLPNVRYLCGFTGSSAVLLVGDAGNVLFTDGRYTAQAKEQVRSARVVIAKKAPLLAAAEWLDRSRRSQKLVVATEAEHLTVANLSRFTDVLPKAIRIKKATGVVEHARMIKDADELEAIRRAVVMAAGLFDTILAVARPGVRESDVAAELEYGARKAGADGMSFETIVAAGRRSALPHGRASNQPLPPEGFVVCDFGVILAGYCSDMTRTLHMGQPSSSASRSYKAVHEAQLAGIAAVRPGITVGEVDRAARNVLKKAGLGRYFTHSTGHGVGLEIHEPPRVAAGQPDVLQPGMVITIEPGAYVPNEWGVRIEDMVVVTDKGCEVLTPTTKQLIAI